MCSEGGVRGNWTSEQAFQEINLILDRLAEEDLHSVPAESMGDDQVALQRSRHHRLVHEEGWTLQLEPDQSWSRSRPNA